MIAVLHASRRATASLLLMTVAVVLLFATLTQAAPPPHAQKPAEWKGKKDFAACGGAKACMGVQKLDRIRRRSGMAHKTVDELAQILDQDKDLVSACLGALLSGAPNTICPAAPSPRGATGSSGFVISVLLRVCCTMQTRRTSVDQMQLPPLPGTAEHRHYRGQAGLQLRGYYSGPCRGGSCGCC